MNPSQFLSQLERGLPAVTLLHGDEPLQLGECLDALRAGARREGISERLTFDASVGFDWLDLGASADNFSLFAERRLFEVRLPGRPGAEGAQAAERIAAGDGADILVIVCPKLDGKATNTAWFRKIDAVATCVGVMPIPAAALPRWLQGRFKQAGVDADVAACELLAERTEGNLLAAVQEVDKLILLAPEGTSVDAELVLGAASNNARFNAFDLVDSAVDGDAVRVVRILGALRGEGVELPPLLGSVTWMVRLLWAVANEASGGRPVGAVLQGGAYRQLSRRVPGVERVIRALGRDGLSDTLRAAQEVDRAIKGRSADEPWAALERICLSLAGTRVLVAEKSGSARPRR
jgi:DNA polymerase III subunit delta